MIVNITTVHALSYVTSIQGARTVSPPSTVPCYDLKTDWRGPKGWDGWKNHSGSGFHDDFWHNMFWIFRCLVGSKMGIEWECKWHILANLNFPWRCHWIKIHKRFTKCHLFRNLNIVRFIRTGLFSFSIQATLQVVAVEAITSLIEMSAAIVLFLFGPQLLPASKRLLRDLKIQPSKNDSVVRISKRQCSSLK